MAVFKVIGAYFGIGMTCGVIDQYFISQEAHLLKSEHIGYSDQDITKLRKFAFGLDTFLWLYSIHGVIKYEPIPTEWELMTSEERYYYISYNQIILKTIRGWHSDVPFFDNISNFIDDVQTGKYDKLSEAVEKSSEAFDKTRKVRPIFRRFQDE